MTRKRALFLIPAAAIIVAAVLIVASFWPRPAAPTPKSLRVSVVALPASFLNETETVVLLAAASDAAGNDQTPNATWSWSAVPASAVQVSPTTAPFRVSLRGVEARNVTVTAHAMLGDLRGNESLTLTVAPIRLTLRSPDLASVGEWVSVSVSVVTASDGTPVSTYNGTVEVSSTDPGAAVPWKHTFTPADRGTHLFNFTFGTSGPWIVAARDTDVPSLNGSTVVRADRRPFANIGIRHDPENGRTVNLTGVGVDPDGDALASYTWDFGDGTGGTGASAVHSYAGDGPFEVGLTVTDAWGLASAEERRTVANFTLGWFAPLPPGLPVTPDRPFTGSLDYMNLFSSKAPWSEAAKHIQFFKLPGEGGLTAPQLSTIIADLNRRGIALGFEAGPLEPTSICGDGIEGFAGADPSIRLAELIAILGGTVQFIDMDEPFAGAVLADGPTACHWTPEQTAREIAAYIAAMRKYVNPAIIIGDTEPILAGVDVSRYEAFVEAFRAVNGYELPFFHADIDYGRIDWPQAVKRLEDFSRNRGIEFGVIYTGDWGDTSDAAWIAHAEERTAAYEVRAGGRPDVADFQSWVDKPDYVLPETSPTSFTHLIDFYYRNRTAATLLMAPPAPNGTRDVSGTLRNRDGNSLAGVPVAVSAQLRAGPALYGEYSVSGTVPAGAERADISLRVNAECGCAGFSDFYVYDIRYVEGADPQNRVPDGNFSRGLGDWFSNGNGTLEVLPSDLGSGWMLHSNTTPTQVTVLGSLGFLATPGESFTLTLDARIPPSAAGTGYFTVRFLRSGATEDVEVGRAPIFLEPAVVLVVWATTDAAGLFHLVLPALPPYSFLVAVAYAGDEYFWPAWADVAVTA